jgi:hypothetical protein
MAPESEPTDEPATAQLPAALPASASLLEVAALHAMIPP